MKKQGKTYFWLGLAILVLSGIAATGCGVYATRPGVLVQPAGVVVARPAAVYATVPPPRVYYDGRWLVYQDQAYYYYSAGAWVVAPSVPVHVARYHRPRVGYIRYSPVHVTSYGHPWRYRGHGGYYYYHHRHYYR
ncbi:MAG: hypothetical protein JW797_12120 [Bradymonadales bacterium]|nr:hypothetical protein [Bradymonadales bacterium]